MHHTDAEHGWAYDRASPIGKPEWALDEAAAPGRLVVDLTSDWTTIFPEASR